MKQIFEFPTNYKQIKAVFGEDKRCVYCYGDAIYNPWKIQIEFHIVVHERIHSAQQEQLGVEYWWMRYLEDKEFRLKQEVEAYSGQYKWVKDNFGDKLARHLLEDVSEVLASGVYGNIINKYQAQSKIRHMAKEL